MDAALFQLPWQNALAGVALILRAGGFLAFAPIVGSDSVPATAKAALALLIAVLLAPVVPAPPPGINLLWLSATEFTAGVMLGFVTSLLFDALVFAGTFVGFPTGLSTAAMMDPVNQSQIPVTATFYQIVGSLMYLAIGGHRQALGALARSYEIVPVGLTHWDGPWIKVFVATTGQVLTIGFRLAAPVLVAGLLVDLCLMLIARAVPQMNILVVGAPIRVAAGLIALAASLHVFAPLVAESADAVLRGAGHLVQALGGRG